MGNFNLIGAMSSLYISIPRSWINRYTITGLAFLFWMSFMDQHDFFTRYKLSRQIAFLENQKVELAQRIEIAKANKADLDHDKEKFAREQYYMHTKNEKVFIIQTQEK